METTVLKVEGMSCGHCSAAVEKAVAEAGASGKVDLTSKRVEVQYEGGPAMLAAIKSAIEDKGYDVK